MHDFFEKIWFSKFITDHILKVLIIVQKMSSVANTLAYTFMKWSSFLLNVKCSWLFVVINALVHVNVKDFYIPVWLTCVVQAIRVYYVQCSFSYTFYFHLYWRLYFNLFLLIFRMGHTCSVPHCKNGYPSSKKRRKFSFYGFPKDTTMKGKWIRAISR